MFKDVAKLEALIPKVIAWDRATPHHYDQRWINLHGMGAMISSLAPAGADAAEVLSLPTEQWDAIAERTRSDYLSDFQQALVAIKARKTQ